MHAYNIGIVKYDYKILLVVTKILAKEIKHLFVKKEGQVESSPQKVCQRNSWKFMEIEIRAKNGGSSY